jgi:hypothetical protein
MNDFKTPMSTFAFTTPATTSSVATQTPQADITGTSLAQFGLAFQFETEQNVVRCCLLLDFFFQFHIFLDSLIVL